MARICWKWCEEDHEHNFAPSATNNFGTNRVTLNAKERESLETQLGVPIHDRHDADKVMKAKNLEFVSPTGSDGRFRREMHEWRREPAATRGPPPKPSA